MALLAALGFEAAPVAADKDTVPPIVLLLVGRDTEPLAGRLAAELLAVGLDVQREEPADDGAPDPMAAALRVRARAAVWVPPGTASAEVWIIDREAGRATIRQSITAEGDEMAPLVALRTVEFLRATLLGLPPAQPPPPRRTKPEVTAPAPPPPETGHVPRLSVGLGAGITASPGGIDPLPSITAVVRASLHGALGVEALGLLSVSPAHSPHASVSISLAGGGLSLRLANGPRAALDVGAGAMGVFLHASDDHPLSAVVGALYGRVGGGVSFTPWLGLRAEGLVGGALAMPDLRVTTTNQTYATWGRPFASAMLNLEARWL